MISSICTKSFMFLPSPYIVRGSPSNTALAGYLIPWLLKIDEKLEAYVTNSFWYDLGSTEKYEKLDNGLIDKLLASLFTY